MTTEPISKKLMFWKAEIEHFQENRVRAFAGVFVDTVTPAKHGDFSKIGIELLRGGRAPPILLQTRVHDCVMIDSEKYQISH